MGFVDGVVVVVVDGDNDIVHFVDDTDDRRRTREN